MNIIVCTKAVPGFVNNPSVPNTHDRVDYEPGSIVINESDDYALEAGVKLAKKSGGKTVVLSCGSLAVQKILQAGLGKDADAALRVDASLFEPTATARALAAAIQKQEYDLVITGVESSDVMAAQVGISIAEMLGVPFAYAVTEIEQGERENTIRITKELGFGKKQVEELHLPALVCFQTGTEPPSFVPVRKMMLAQRKPIKSLTPAELDVDGQPLSIEVVEIFSPKEAGMAEIIEGDPGTQASVVMQKIREVL
jgi:electron transfer flavoprotein beta subunit